MFIALWLAMMQQPNPPDSRPPAPSSGAGSAQTPSGKTPNPQKPGSETVVTTRSPRFVANQVAGTWEKVSDDKNENVMGITLHLAADGTATLTTGIQEDFNYNFDGKKLIVVDADDPDQVKQVSAIVLTGDHLKETNTDTGQSAEFVRVSPRAGSHNAYSIAGEWKRDTSHLPFEPGLDDAEKQKRLRIAQNGRYYYQPDGRLFVRIPLTSESGTWGITPEGELHLELAGKVKEQKVTFEDGDLVLTGHDAEAETYHRAEYE
jgi:hypothetical protein